MRQKLRALHGELRNRDGFLGPVLTLVSGAAVAHLITAVALVFLARLYSPADFGVLAMYSSIVYTVAVAACLRFDVAIVLPSETDTARNLFWLSLVAAAFVSILIAAAVAFLPLAHMFDGALAPVAPYFWLLPINVLAIGCYAALQGWFVRDKAYSFISKTRVAQSAGAAGTQIGAGLLAPAPIGLIIGFMINSGAAALLMSGKIASQFRSTLKWPGSAALHETLTRYRDFPRFSVWEALANSASIQLPIILIGALASSQEVGQVALAMSVVQAPLALFGTAAAQVFMARAPEEARGGQLRSFVLRTIQGLAKTGTPLLLALAILSPPLFPLVFGREWAHAGWLVTWMAPWLVLQFLASPISTALNVVGKLRLSMMLQVFGLALRLGIVWVGAVMWDAASEAYALSGAVFYGIVIAVIVKATRQ